MFTLLCSDRVGLRRLFQECNLLSSSASSSQDHVQLRALLGSATVTKSRGERKKGVKFIISDYVIQIRTVKKIHTFIANTFPQPG